MTERLSPAQRAVAQLSRLQQDDDENLNNCSTNFLVDSEEESVDESPSPILDLFVEECGLESILKITSFTLQEINSLYDPIELEVFAEWVSGKGKKPKVSPKDAFFMMLVVFKTYGSWDFHAANFRMKTSTFLKTVTRIMDIIEPLLCANYIKKPCLDDLHAENQLFENYPYALYATDVRFQQSLRPSGNVNEVKNYFSGKHHLYGYKIEYSVAPNGQCVHLTKHYPGAKSDLTICRENLQAHKVMLRKKQSEHQFEDTGELYNQYKQYWALLADKGYQGLALQLRAIIPTKKPANGVLSRAQVQRNKEVSSDRVLAERYFGRLNSLWGIMAKQFKWTEQKYDSCVKICVALTNYHVLLNPLNHQDLDQYRKAMARLKAIASRKNRKRQQSQQRYRQKINQRLNYQEDPAPNQHHSEIEEEEKAEHSDGSATILE